MKKQRRTEKLVANLEPLIMSAVLRYIELPEVDMTASEYGRQLIIRDLKEKGLISDDMLISATV